MVKIAIVEDEEAIANMFATEFTNAGFEVKTAENGQTGMVLLQQWKPDIALVDLLMPVMSGQQLIEEVRATDWGKTLLIMALTNLSQPEAGLELGSSGFDDYAVKVYYTPKQLREKVTKLLEEKASPTKQ
jgi:DNA-binding response OmpR family regulator